MKKNTTSIIPRAKEALSMEQVLLKFGVSPVYTIDPKGPSETDDVELFQLVQDAPAIKRNS